MINHLLKKTKNEVLVEAAKNGDESAFNELVHRYRTRAFVWAKNITKDIHLAEDIVQEALFNAFLQLSSISNPSQFESWLYTIVRNQTYMKLRTVAYKREQSFTVMKLENNGTEDQLDSFIHYMMKKTPISGDAENDPSKIVEATDFELMMLEVLEKLSATEKSIFMDHYFNDFLPIEIAKRHGITIDNVYKILSRSRAKVKEERFRLYMKEYIHERKKTKTNQNVVILPQPNNQKLIWKQNKNTFVCSLYCILQHSKTDHYSFTDVMGLTSQAFRMTIETEQIDKNGHYMYFWEPVFMQGLNNLGLTCTMTGDGGVSPSPYMLNQGIHHIRESLSQGNPLMAWDLFSVGFGIIYGYDDHNQVLYALDGNKTRTIPYERLGRGTTEGLFILSFSKANTLLHSKTALKSALQMIIKHAYREMTFIGYATGLSAYDHWKNAFLHKKVNPLGNAFCAAYYANARKHAALFMYDQAKRYKHDIWVSKLFKDTANSYSTVAKLLTRISELFPLPKGGVPSHPDKIKLAVQYLETAKENEEECLNKIKQLIHLL
ncbi:RNA polymerase sigma factor [Chengkuizengella axinellae]|uniref:RNA polymerase sigma factor n=1 Tax=Chengkuizengella axinellae TaxID=3064388 RepID=A0ABT9IUB0_9BACL|nr:RNA polymerase sigma factor [Chengkuizengella sp. 2205SS18-9]MDP5272892.1 RNA polymerase sigma factor [Chengkuizengella sp. 2205SS18-9]